MCENTLKLQGICDFSSNNNICGSHFKFCWEIFIMTDWLEFRTWVFWQPFWTEILDFRLQISEVPTEVLHF